MKSKIKLGELVTMQQNQFPIIFVTRLLIFING